MLDIQIPTVVTVRPDWTCTWVVCNQSTLISDLDYHLDSEYCYTATQKPILK